MYPLPDLGVCDLGIITAPVVFDLLHHNWQQPTQGFGREAVCVRSFLTELVSTDGWDDEFLPGYASGASDDGDLF